MTLSLTLACLWAIVASTVALVPSKHRHWPQAYALIAVGIPLLGYVTYENGPTAGLICLAAGASILRWPVLYLFRWVIGSAKPGVVAREDDEQPAARPGE
jgi:hypothetical protein